MSRKINELKRGRWRRGSSWKYNRHDVGGGVGGGGGGKGPKSPRCALYDVKTIMVYIGGDTSSRGNGRQYIILLRRRRSNRRYGNAIKNPFRDSVHSCIADDGYNTLMSSGLRKRGTYYNLATSNMRAAAVLR